MQLFACDMGYKYDMLGRITEETEVFDAESRGDMIPSDIRANFLTWFVYSQNSVQMRNAVLRFIRRICLFVRFQIFFRYGNDPFFCFEPCGESDFVSVLDFVEPEFYYYQPSKHCRRAHDEDNERHADSRGDPDYNRGNEEGADRNAKNCGYGDHKTRQFFFAGVRGKVFVVERLAFFFWQVGVIGINGSVVNVFVHITSQPLRPCNFPASIHRNLYARRNRRA